MYTSRAEHGPLPRAPHPIYWHNHGGSSSRKAAGCLPDEPIRGWINRGLRPLSSLLPRT